jgi:glycosyltransferase involved in cell wall biosynthesis
MKPRDSRAFGRSHLLAIGPFPPAVTGAAKNTAMVCDAVEARGAQVRRLPTNKTRGRAEHVRSLGLYANKTLGFLGNLRRILTTGSADATNTTVYLVPDGGRGVAFSSAYARVASAKFLRLVVHHRNYSHIETPSALMADLARTVPGRTLHVFLDPVMEKRFKSVYTDQLDSIYVPNAATCDVQPAERSTTRDASDPVVVGFLSNLVEEKGFDAVAEAFVDLNQRLGSKVRFLLAGRPVGAGNAARLEQLKRGLGDRLDYQGEVFGVAKTAFFRTCDIFVFPTRYDQEAQPNVLYEAMAGGSMIVSTRWAGVPWVLEDTVHRLVEPSPDCASDIVAAVEDLLTTEDLGSVRVRQAEAFRAKKADADTRYASLLDRLLGVTGHEPRDD